MNNNLYIKYDTTLLNDIPVSEVADFLGASITKKGSSLFTHCLWHDDSNPSMILNQKTGCNNYHCFVCDHTASVIDYTMAHESVDFKTACQMLSERFGIQVDANTRYKDIRHQQSGVSVHKRQKAQTQPVTPKANIASIPMECVERVLTLDDGFTQCMTLLFGEETAKRVAHDYHLGRYDGVVGNGDMITGGTMFWLIDQQGNVRNCKLQVYETNTSSERFCHFDHTPGRIQFIGWQFKRDGFVPQDAEFDNTCLFGEHLLAQHPNNTVALVESPKNALLGACMLKEMTWIATGSKGMMKPEVLQPLRNRRVIVFPDRDAISDWRQRAESMKDIACFYVSDFCEREAPADCPKYDIGDYIVERRMEYVPF